MYYYSPPRDSDASESESESESEEIEEVSGGEARGHASNLSTLKSWKRQLGRSINAIETFGDVAWSNHYQHIMLPGLEVGGTAISLPLVTPRDADFIRKACHAAPFGRGDETVVDESVRKTWEIGHEGFTFSNPRWHNFVNTLLKEASVSLGIITGPLACELNRTSFFYLFQIGFKTSALASTVKPGYPSDPTPHWSELGAYSNYEESEVTHYMTLVKQCLLHGFSDEASRFLEDCCEKIAEEHKGIMLPTSMPVTERDAYSLQHPKFRNNRSWAELFLVDVVSILQLSGKPAPASAKPLFEKLVRYYVLAEAPAYPKKPRGWAHKPRHCLNTCSNYTELVEFLTSPSEKTRHFKRNLQDRKHIEQQLSSKYFDCATLRTAPPHVLVVTKKGTEYGDELRWFNDCIQKLELRLKLFKTPFVRDMLGEELFAELVCLGKIRGPSHGNPPLALTEEVNMTPGILAEGAGNKRPASDNLERPMATKVRVTGEVIDLTEDD